MEQRIELLALQAKQGDTTALAALYDATVRDIYRFVSFKVRQQSTAEDITSDIFLTVVAKLHTFNPKKGTFRTWIYTIARRTIIDHYRKHKHTSNVSDAWDIADEEMSQIQDGVDLQLFSESIESLLKQLSAKERDIIVMRVWEDMSYDEIATILGTSTASCRMAYSRALRTLRDIMPTFILALIQYNV